MTIEESMKQIYAIIEQLKAEFPQRTFTPDGKLVGDLGEALVARTYQVKLATVSNNKGYDAEDETGRKVQIKTSQDKNGLGINEGNIPYYFIGIILHKDGSFQEAFNGPGLMVSKTTGWSWKTLYALNAKVESSDRIALRPGFYKDEDGWIRNK